MMSIVVCQQDSKIHDKSHMIYIILIMLCLCETSLRYEKYFSQVLKIFETKCLCVAHFLFMQNKLEQFFAQGIVYIIADTNMETFYSISQI